MQAKLRQSQTSLTVPNKHQPELLQNLFEIAVHRASNYKSPSLIPSGTKYLICCFVQQQKESKSQTGCRIAIVNDRDNDGLKIEGFIRGCWMVLLLHVLSARRIIASKMTWLIPQSQMLCCIEIYATAGIFTWWRRPHSLIFHKRSWDNIVCSQCALKTTNWSHWHQMLNRDGCHQHWTNGLLSKRKHWSRTIKSGLHLPWHAIVLCEGYKPPPSRVFKVYCWNSKGIAACGRHSMTTQWKAILPSHWVHLWEHDISNSG